MSAPLEVAVVTVSQQQALVSSSSVWVGLRFAVQGTVKQQTSHGASPKGGRSLSSSVSSPLPGGAQQLRGSFMLRARSTLFSYS